MKIPAKLKNFGVYGVGLNRFRKMALEPISDDGFIGFVEPISDDVIMGFVEPISDDGFMGFVSCRLSFLQPRSISLVSKPHGRNDE